MNPAGYLDLLATAGILNLSSWTPSSCRVKSGHINNNGAGKEGGTSKVKAGKSTGKASQKQMAQIVGLSQYVGRYLKLLNVLRIYFLDFVTLRQTYYQK